MWLCSVRVPAESAAQRRGYDSQSAGEQREYELVRYIHYFMRWLFAARHSRASSQPFDTVEAEMKWMWC